MRIYCVILLLLISSVTSAQTGKGPCPRNQPVIAYHQKEQAIFLFGGFCIKHKKRLNDLWRFNGQEWTPIANESAPPARSGHTMIYDAIHHQLIVFGGKSDEGTLSNDLWAWDGKKWEALQGQVEEPVPRQSHRMAFNPKSGEMFLFGGSDNEGNALNDSWVFRDDSWIQLASKNLPPARLQHTLSYDQFRNVMVLFGGFSRKNGEKHVYGDTWEWKFSDGWSQKADDERMARDHHAMAYDTRNKRTILFGGYNQGYFGDVLGWDGYKWSKLLTEDSLARAGKPGFVFDSLKEALVLFGGWDQNNRPLMDFWQFNFNEKSWNPY